MAESRKSAEKQAEEARAAGDPVPVDAAADGGEPRIREQIRDAKHPDEKPDPSTVAQVEELKDT